MSSSTAGAQKYPTWRDVVIQESKNAGQGLHSLSDKSFQDVEDQLIGADTSVLIMCAPTEEGKEANTATDNSPRLTLLHHLSKLELAKSPENNAKTATEKTSVYVALEGLEAQATPVELACEKGLYEDKIEIRAPRWQAFKDIDSHEKLAKLLEEGDLPAASASITLYTVRKFQVVPPVLHSVLLQRSDNDDLSLAPAALLLGVLQTIQDRKTENKKNAKENPDDEIDVYCRGIVAFLWHLSCTSKSKLDVSCNLFHATKSPEALEWSKKLHVTFIDTSIKIEETVEDAKDDTTGSPNGKPTGKKTRTWQENYMRLVAYKTLVGDCNVPREYAKDKALGEWVKNQRSVSKTLPKERRAQLEDIGFTFSSTQLDRSKKIWDANYERLALLTKKHEGSFTKALKEDRSLQHWVTIQRQSHRRGNMDEERKKKLDDIDFIWKIKNDYTPRKKNDMQWQKGYEKLMEFHKEHKHCNVPKRPTDCRPLWEWVYSQRKAYTEKRLPADRIKLMEDLGMVWDNDMGQVIRDAQWSKKFDDAKVFFDKHQHLEVPRSGKFGNNNLLKWLLRQREQYKNDKLCAPRKRMLEDLKFDFDGNTERRDRLLEELNWKDRYEELEFYKREKGSIPEGGTTAKEKSLAKWVAKCQVAHQFYDLDPDRKAMLDKLGVVFPAQMPEPPMKKRTSSATPTRKAAKAAKVEVMPMVVDEGIKEPKLPALKLASLDNKGTDKIKEAVAKAKTGTAKEDNGKKKDDANNEPSKKTSTKGANNGQKRKAEEDPAEAADTYGKKSEPNDNGRKLRRGKRDRGGEPAKQLFV